MRCQPVAILFMVGSITSAFAAGDPAILGTVGPDIEALGNRAFQVAGVEKSGTWKATVIDQDYWPHHFVFRLDCHCGGYARVLPYTVVMSDTGEGVIVSEDPFRFFDEEPPGEGMTMRYISDYERVDHDAVDRFNAISESEGVVVEPDYSRSYVEFFLNLYLSDDAVFIPSTTVVQAVLSIAELSEESEALADAFGGINKPTVLVTNRWAHSATATTYGWAPWCGEIDRYTIDVDEEGQVSLAISTFGEQPVRLGDDAADPAD